MASALVAKVTNNKETINFYRDGDGVIGYRFGVCTKPWNSTGATPTMEMKAKRLRAWLGWAKDNGYTVDYQGPIA